MNRDNALADAMKYPYSDLDLENASVELLGQLGTQSLEEATVDMRNHAYSILLTAIELYDVDIKKEGFLEGYINNIYSTPSLRRLARSYLKGEIKQPKDFYRPVGEQISTYVAALGILNLDLEDLPNHELIRPITEEDLTKKLEEASYGPVEIEEYEVKVTERDLRNARKQLKTMFNVYRLAQLNPIIREKAANVYMKTARILFENVETRSDMAGAFHLAKGSAPEIRKISEDFMNGVIDREKFYNLMERQVIAYKTISK